MKPRILVVEHEPNGGLDWMAPGLTAGADVQVVRPHRGEALPAADFGPGTGLVVLGGAMGALDDDVAPWLPATRALLADAVRAGVPTLGICLGAQLLAAATGGTVGKGDPGLEIGLVEVRPVATDPFVAALTAGVTDWSVNQYHYDAVTELPPDAELLVTGDRYPHQAFRVGERAWGVQYHPEVSTAVFEEWVGHGLASGELPADAGAIVGPVRAAAGVQRTLAAAHAGSLLQQFD